MSFENLGKNSEITHTEQTKNGITSIRFGEAIHICWLYILCAHTQHITHKASSNQYVKYNRNSFCFLLHIFSLLDFYECDNINLQMPQQCDTFTSGVWKEREREHEMSIKTIVILWWSEHSMFRDKYTDDIASVAPSFIGVVANTYPLNKHCKNMIALSVSHTRRPDYRCPISLFKWDSMFRNFD